MARLIYKTGEQFYTAKMAYCLFNPPVYYSCQNYHHQQSTYITVVLCCSITSHSAKKTVIDFFNAFNKLCLYTNKCSLITFENKKNSNTRNRQRQVQGKGFKYIIVFIEAMALELQNNHVLIKLNLALSETHHFERSKDKVKLYNGLCKSANKMQRDLFHVTKLLNKICKRLGSVVKDSSSAVVL